MKASWWTRLSVTQAAVFTFLALPAFSQELGPPTVDQAPPFPVPEAGYEVEGRPGLMLSIPHLKFIDWESFEGPGIPSGLQRRLLSVSPSMGAVSQITYVPPGWSHPAGYHDVDNEIFLLEGDLTINDGEADEKLTKYSYSYMPAGQMHGLESRQGAVLLQWWKGKPDFVASSRDKKGTRVYARVRDWNRFQEPWYVNKPFPDYRTGGNFPGYLHTLLRQDPDTGEMTWMTFVSRIPAPPSSEAGNFGGGAEVHPSFEEYFFPEGSRFVDVDNRAPEKSQYRGECVEQGVSTYERGTRGYFWRAAGVAHGTVAKAPARPRDGDGNLVGGNGEAGWGWTLVRTGTRLWATYVTDCEYETGIEYMGEGRWRKYDYDVPRYNPKN